MVWYGMVWYGMVWTECLSNFVFLMLFKRKSPQAIPSPHIFKTGRWFLMFTQLVAAHSQYKHGFVWRSFSPKGQHWLSIKFCDMISMGNGTIMGSQWHHCAPMHSPCKCAATTSHWWRTDLTDASSIDPYNPTQTQMHVQSHVVLSIYLSMYLSFFLSYLISSYLFLSIFLSIYLYIYLCIYLSFFLSILSYLILSHLIFSYLSIYLSIYIYLYLYLCVYIYTHIRIDFFFIHTCLHAFCCVWLFMCIYTVTPLPGLYEKVDRYISGRLAETFECSASGR